MRIERATLDTCSQSRGTVVVIDVLRAFTTSAFCLAAGARDLLLVSTIAEAFHLKAQNPDWLLMGENDGYPIPGFDLGNSPSAIAGKDMTGRRLILRTTAGTQGAVRAVRAELLLASSLSCATATATYIRNRAPETVTLLETGVTPHGIAEEDVACADCIEAMLTDTTLHRDTILAAVWNSWGAQKFRDPTQYVFPLADLECAMEIDRFEFAMVVNRGPDGLILSRASVEGI